MLNHVLLSSQLHHQIKRFSRLLQPFRVSQIDLHTHAIIILLHLTALPQSLLHLHTHLLLLLLHLILHRIHTTHKALLLQRSDQLRPTLFSRHTELREGEVVYTGARALQRGEGGRENNRHPREFDNGEGDGRKGGEKRSRELEGKRNGLVWRKNRDSLFAPRIDGDLRHGDELRKRTILQHPQRPQLFDYQLALHCVLHPRAQFARHQTPAQREFHLSITLSSFRHL